jgi:hypothetical protein
MQKMQKSMDERVVLFRQKGGHWESMHFWQVLARAKKCIPHRCLAQLLVPALLYLRGKPFQCR